MPIEAQFNEPSRRHGAGRAAPLKNGFVPNTNNHPGHDPERAHPGEHQPLLTRHEFASLFGVSGRTVKRWEDRFELPVHKKNHRVLRYPLEAVVVICAHGVAIRTKVADELGLYTEQLLGLASQRRGRAVARDAIANPEAVTTMIVAADEDERLLIELWRNQEKGALLRAVVRALAGSKISAGAELKAS